MHNWKHEQKAHDQRHPAAHLMDKTGQSVTAKAHDHATPRPLMADAKYRQGMSDDQLEV